MALAAFLAFSILAADPAVQAPVQTQAQPPARSAGARTGPHAVAAAVSETDGGEDDDGDIAPGAPADDYGFVSWCYGALNEYLAIYDVVKPDLKDIDAMFGTSVQEAEPYTADVAAERVALKRFGAAISAAERTSATPIAAEGAAEIEAGRGIWVSARRQPHRKLADAWLFWGIPKRCETAAKALTSRAAKGGPARGDAPSAIAAAAAAALLDDSQTAAIDAPAPAAPPLEPKAPPPTPPRAGAEMVGGK